MGMRSLRHPRPCKPAAPVLLLLLLLAVSILQSAHHVHAASEPSPASTPAPSSSSSSTPTPEPTSPKNPRDEDPVIQKVRGLRNKAMRLNDQRAWQKSILKLRDALTLMHDRVFGEGRHAITVREDISQDAALYAQLLNDYGNVLTRADEYDEAIEVLEDAVEMIKRVFGESHPSYGLSLRSLADAYLAKKNFKTAIRTYKTLRKQIKLGLGKEHEAYLEVHLKIADAYKKNGDSPRAVKTLKKVLADQDGQINGATEGMGEVYMELASLQHALGVLDEALQFSETARVILQMRDGEISIPYAFSLNTQAGVLMTMERTADAYAQLQEAHRIALELYGEGHAMVLSSAKTLEQVRLRLESEKTQGKEPAKDEL